MTKFRKKPVVIHAEQWFPSKNITGVEINWDNNPMRSDSATIKTLEGRLHVSSGDWIITGVQGEKYPCKPDIFEMTYEAIE